MIVKYYNNPELAYTTRGRYKVLNFTPFAEEEQKSVLLGDGASTTVKTKKSNICNYVTIDDTRWYVTHYTYMNGGQVELYLQRDVIGEFGLKDCFGKIERGYTTSLLRNRKELNLNQILKKRVPLKPLSGVYGNYYVQDNNHDNEMWGILYMVKPSDGAPNFTVNIPAFTPIVMDYGFIENGDYINISSKENCSISFRVRFSNSLVDSYGHYPVYEITIRYYFDQYAKEFLFQPTYVGVKTLSVPEFQITHDFLFDASDYTLSESELKDCAVQIGIIVGNYLLNNNSTSVGYVLPSITEDIVGNYKDYNGVTIKNNDKYYTYSTQQSVHTKSGFTTTSRNSFYTNCIIPLLNNKTVFIGKKSTVLNVRGISDDDNLKLKSEVEFTRLNYTYRELTAEEAGIITFDVSKQLVDEPFIILATPLYDVTVNGSLSSDTYNISKEKAFSVFNSVIEALSGERGYLVDAQIYPYCPVLTDTAAVYKGLPFFSINSSCYEHDCEVQLLPSSDIKREYIERQYSIVSPEQSSKFSFYFYDYTTKVDDVNGTNFAKLRIKVKTALKPYAIISSAVIQPDEDSLIGITYPSDLRGSQPTSNGFECSLASNAFEQYKRQNSNFQQLFNLDKEELRKQHTVELVNDITGAVVNTITGTTMGAIAGSSMADAGVWGFASGSKSIGAGVGAGVAADVVGKAMIAQTIANDSLRKYEESLQQQRFDLQIGTIKNLPNSINRISSFNEIILKNFWYYIETYECSEYEKGIVDNFIARYGYGIGVFDNIVNYQKDGWFIRSTLISSSYPVVLHQIAEKELMGGIYYYSGGNDL